MAKTKKSEPSINLVVKVKDSKGQSWTETWTGYPSNTSIEDAENHCRRTIDQFNKTEEFRYKEKANLREFISVEIGRVIEKEPAEESEEDTSHYFF